ncbi:MAG: exonuclease SbcCD subunit D [Actinomycetota bacterium]
MRLLHTGDWHVGRSIRGRSRMDEFAAALGTVVEVAETEGCDAVLVAGDVYDQRAVTPDADAVIFETFIKLFERNIGVVCIPGNHDSAARLAAFAPLLARVGTSVVPRVLPPDAGALVEVPARDGSESALVACLPFVSPRRFSDAASLFEDMTAGYVNFDSNMGVLMASYERHFRRDRVNVLMGHLFVGGAKPSGSERQVTIGAEYAVSPQRLPATASYVALGHIHRAQKVAGAPSETRYCGSLLQLDFGEAGQDKSVTVVEARPGLPPRAGQVAVEAGRRLVTVTATLDTLDKVAGDAGDAYLTVNLRVDQPVPGLADRVRAALPNALDVRLVLPQPEEAEARPSLRGLDPKQQFLQYYEAAHGAPPVDELVIAFETVYEEVTAP